MSNSRLNYETALQAKNYIKEKYNINFHLHWVQKLLKKKLQLTFKKNRLKPGKISDESIQIEFIKWYEKELY